MLTIEMRPMTATERGFFQASLEPRPEGCFHKGFNYFIACAVGPLVGILLVSLPAIPLDHFHLLSRVVSEVLGWFGVLAGLIVGLSSLRNRRREEAIHRAIFQKDLDDGQVKVLHCTVSRAVLAEGDEDVGPDYFLEVGEDLVLFLRGINVLDYEEDEEDGKPRAFPNQKMGVVQATVSNTVLEVICLGDPLPESQLLELEQWPKDTYPPADGEVLPISLDRLDEELTRLGKLKNGK